ncbi:MAG: hypothetical protein GX610_24525 [Rhodococcus sp.]|nr:hypothetical protein [Rhodococcus sp. (in: high G+C Gram-positive bacteria)]
MLVDQLPDTFLEVVLEAENGNIAGLCRFTADLDEHLRQELGMRPTTDPWSAHRHPSVVEAMTELGIPPSESYRIALSRGHGR